MGRYCCRTFEVKRRLMYEKALYPLATSPVARGVNRWLLAGDWDTIICSWLWRKQLCRVLLALRDHVTVPDEAGS